VKITRYKDQGTRKIQEPRSKIQEPNKQEEKRKEKKNKNLRNCEEDGKD